MYMPRDPIRQVENFIKRYNIFNFHFGLLPLGEIIYTSLSPFPNNGLTIEQDIVFSLGSVTGVGEGKIWIQTKST